MKTYSSIFEKRIFIKPFKKSGDMNGRVIFNIFVIKFGIMKIMYQNQNYLEAKPRPAIILSSNHKYVCVIFQLRCQIQLVVVLVIRKKASFKVKLSYFSIKRKEKHL